MAAITAPPISGGFPSYGWGGLVTSGALGAATPVAAPKITKTLTLLRTVNAYFSVVPGDDPPALVAVTTQSSPTLRRAGPYLTQQPGEPVLQAIMLRAVTVDAPVVVNGQPHTPVLRAGGETASSVAATVEADRSLPTFIGGGTTVMVYSAKDLLAGPVDSWPEHHGGPSMLSSGGYRPVMGQLWGEFEGQTWDAVTFRADAAQHFWLDLGTVFYQMTCLALVVPHSHPFLETNYLLDTGQPTAALDVSNAKVHTVSEAPAFRARLTAGPTGLAMSSEAPGAATDKNLLRSARYRQAEVPVLVYGVFNYNESRVGHRNLVGNIHRYNISSNSEGVINEREYQHLVIGRSHGSVGYAKASQMSVLEYQVRHEAMSLEAIEREVEQMRMRYDIARLTRYANALVDPDADTKNLWVK